MFGRNSRSIEIEPLATIISKVIEIKVNNGKIFKKQFKKICLFKMYAKILNKSQFSQKIKKYFQN